MGQSLIFYIYDEQGNLKHENWINAAISFSENYTGPNLLDLNVSDQMEENEELDIFDIGKSIQDAQDQIDNYFRKMHTYKMEYSGEKVYSIVENEIILGCEHGEIANYLAKILKEEGYHIANDQKRDLYIVESGKIKYLFEIKTDVSTTSIYTGLGQLLINSLDDESIKKLFFVLPESTKNNYPNLEKYNVTYIFFTYNDNGIEFKNILYIKEILKNG